MPWSPSYDQFFFDSMKLFVNFFSPKMLFLNFRMNHTFLGVAFNAPFDLSWGSRRLISYTYQKPCFMTISRFRFFYFFFSLARSGPAARSLARSLGARARSLDRSRRLGGLGGDAPRVSSEKKSKKSKTRNGHETSFLMSI